MSRERERERSSCSFDRLGGLAGTPRGWLREGAGGGERCAPGNLAGVSAEGVYPRLSPVGRECASKGPGTVDHRRVKASRVRLRRPLTTWRDAVAAGG